MLDSIGKLFESIILKRLEEKINDLGGLSPSQYGFRRGKSTVDAIDEVVNIAKNAKEKKHFCAIITLDVRNAFNSAKWSVIKNALKKKGVNGYLYNIIDDYLHNRTLLYETTVGMKERELTVGVPQGSVLGPFLWNIMYDDLLNMKLQKGAKIIGYADDIALVIEQSTTELVQIIANSSLRRCNKWLESRGLELAANKTEAILVTNRRKYVAPKLRLQNTDIQFSRNLCYLGVQIDDRLSFSKHIQNVRNKALRTATTLAKIMPNIGGPKAQTRKLLNSVVHSQLLYAAPAFANVVYTKRQVNELQKSQRVSALRVISAYRTVSTAAALVISGIPPIDLLILERKEIYIQMKQIGESLNVTERKIRITEIRNTARSELLNKWQDRWNREHKGRWTYKLIPNIKVWIERKHGNINYYLTQIMTNHGDFNQYLQRFKIKNTALCEFCSNENETAQHLLFGCRRFNEHRQELNNALKTEISQDNLLPIMLTSQENWSKCESYMQAILSAKITASPNLLT